MKTLRVFLWGSALGALVGLILAPRRNAIERAQLAEERGNAGASGGRTATIASGPRATPEEAEAAGYRPRQV